MTSNSTFSIVYIGYYAEISKQFTDCSMSKASTEVRLFGIGFFSPSLRRFSTSFNHKLSSSSREALLLMSFSASRNCSDLVFDLCNIFI